MPEFEAILASMTREERAHYEEYVRRRKLKKIGGSFLEFVTFFAPWFCVEEFHVLVAEKFQALHEGLIDRLMIFAPPRAGKSALTSYFLPLWWMGNHPSDQILHVSYAAPLVEGFGRQIKNAMMADAFREVFPGCELAKDSKSSGRWATTANGLYHAAGANTGIAGKGFHLGLIDDPISEQDAFSRTLRKNINEWYGPGFYTRRMPERNAIVITQTRWAVDDLSGYLLANAVTVPGADQWVVLRIPGVIDQETAGELNRVASDPRYQEFLHEGPQFYVSGGSFAPRRWPLKTLQQSMNQLSRKDRAALYQQSPTEEGGSIIKADEWRKWSKDKPLPKFEYLLQAYDTAFEPEEANDYSARTTWGVFRHPTTGRQCAMLLDRLQERMEFPDLRAEAYRSYKEYRPDRVLIEKKASGHSLVQELRRKGVPVTAQKIKGSKEARGHAVTVLFEQGCVFYIDGLQWADDVVDHCATFPNGAHDDVYDTVTLALGFLRRMFLVDVPDDEQDDDETPYDDVPLRAYAQLHGSYARG